ncbi:MAG: PAS domain-containing protein [Gammaproteobacteria bacterium]|nr:PAS domain-containing protein [Gammaproteobacteria bacterium]
MKKNRLYSSENRKQACYQLLLSGTDVCLHEIDLDGHLISMYPLALKSPDLSFDDVRGCHYPDLFDQDDRTNLKDLMERAIQGEAFEYEFSFEIEGDQQVFSSSFVPITDLQGQIVKLAGFTQNFSVQIKATIKHEQSLDRFRNLADNIDGIVCEADAISYQFLNINQFAVRLLGYPPHVLKAPDFWLDKMHPEDREWVPDYCNKCREEGPSSYHIEYRMIAADGRVVWLRDFRSTGFDNQYRRVLRGIMVDITERVEAERLFRDMVDAIDGIVWERTAGSDRLNFVSQRVVNLLGYSADSLLASGYWIQIIHPEDRKRAVDYSRECVKSELKQFQQEYRMIASDGRTLWFRDCVTVTREVGKRPLLRGIVIDITEWKSAES